MLMIRGSFFIEWLSRTALFQLLDYVADSDEDENGATGLEPVASYVTGSRSNELYYASANDFSAF